jgi:hypothetical protein
MAAGVYNFTIEQGTTVAIDFAYQTAAGVAIPLTNYTARMQARETISSPVAVIDATTSNGQLSVDGAGGIVSLALSATVTAALDFRTAAYDLEIVSQAGVVTRLVQGTITLSREVTR